MSHQYKDRAQYLVYFAVGALFGAYGGLRVGENVDPWWRPTLVCALGFGGLANLPRR